MHFSIKSNLALLFKNSPFSFILAITLSIAVGLSAPFDILIRTNLINTAMQSLINGSGFITVLPFLAGTIGIFILTCLQVGIDNFLNTRISIKSFPIIKEMLLRRIASLSYSNLEHVNTKELLTRIEEKLENQVIAGFSGITQILKIAINIAGTMFIVMTVVWWFAPILLFSLAVTVVAAIYNGKVVTKGWTHAGALLMHWLYFDSLNIDRNTAAERKLFDTTGFIKTNCRKRAETCHGITQKVVFDIEKVSFITKIINFLMQFLILFLFLKPLMDGTISFSFYLAAIMNIVSLQQYLNKEASNIIKNITESVLYWKEVNKLFELKSDSNYLSAPIFSETFSSLEFKDVWFRYPQTENDILKGISFEIKAGRHYALVGENGSGKSTIIKLACGLYSPNRGSIILNGRSIDEYSPGQLKGMFSVMFQDFARYYTTVKDNILFGDMSISAEEKMQAIIDRMDLRSAIQELPYGINTVLGKIRKEGIDLSGGQWQRLAITRGLYSSAPVKIFDEPTAALDPISETELYEQYLVLLKDNTSLFISHRLGSTKLASEIIVIQDGIVEERGTHVDLMNNKGVYAEMFLQQSQWYDKRSWIYDKQ